MSISKTSDGRWSVKFKQDGKWRQRMFRDETAAAAFNAGMAGAVEGRLSLRELAAAYVRSRKETLHPTTLDAIRFLIRDGGPAAFMAEKYADSLNRTDLETFRENLRLRNVTNRTINAYHAYIRAILAWGADQALISGNPWRDFRKLKCRKYAIAPDLEAFRKIYAELPPYMQWAAKTAFCLALRPGRVELFDLRWEAFDWRRSMVTVRQGKTGILKHVYPPMAYLKEARERFATDRARGIPWVCHRNGMKIFSWRTAWLGACRRAGVQMRPYDIRHCAATEMLAAGADLAAVSCQLGHTSVATTGAVYAHITRGAQASAAALLPKI